jgi:hypothetical protein
VGRSILNARQEQHTAALLLENEALLLVSLHQHAHQWLQQKSEENFGAQFFWVVLNDAQAVNPKIALTNL